MLLPRLAAAFVVTLSLGAHAADCQALLEQHLAGDLTLAVDAFDQDDHQGWRVVEDAGCDAEAAAKSGFNPPNLKAVDRLQRCFGQPYKIAYECP